MEAALRHLRYRDRPRKLWVDTICINQADNDEKSVQVRRMARIYRSAYRVVAWLGPQRDRSNLALSALEWLGRQQVHTQEGWFYLAPCIDSEWHSSTKEVPYSPEVWEALRHLLGREWLERPWVVQRITVANRMAIVQCGRREIS